MLFSYVQSSIVITPLGEDEAGHFASGPHFVVYVYQIFLSVPRTVILTKLLSHLSVNVVNRLLCESKVHPENF